MSVGRRYFSKYPMRLQPSLSKLVAHAGAVPSCAKIDTPALRILAICSSGQRHLPRSGSSIHQPLSSDAAS